MQDSIDKLKRHGCCVFETTATSNLSEDPVSARCTIVGLCMSGSIDFEFNMEPVHLEAGMRVVYPHVTLVRVLRQSPDYRLRLLVMSNDFSFDSMEGINVDVLQAVMQVPVATVSDAGVWRLLESLFDSLEACDALGCSPYAKQVRHSLARNVLLSLIDCQIGENADRRRGVYNNADVYFRRFVNLVDDHVHAEHEVAFYAAQLGITPKYISEICKAKTGRKAKEIISAVLLRKLKAELATSGKPMHQLAEEYGFSDQSSLGKFFRKFTGLSPLHYKQHTS